MLNKKIQQTLGLFLVVLNAVYAQFEENNFYTPPTSFPITVNLVADFGVDNNFTTNDSGPLQSAINFVNEQGGGKILIPEGNYTFADIALKSNVHIIINSKATIRPNIRNNTRNYRIFSFGENSATINNVSISGEDNKRFTIDLRFVDNKRVAVCSFNNVNNFLISDFNIEDAQTFFSCFTFGHTYHDTDGDNTDAYPNLDLDNDGNFEDPQDDVDDYHFPENGIVKNCSAFNTDYGYGLVQTQSGKNILFKNLFGEGGITLRHESGFTGLNNLQRPALGLTVAGLDQMFSTNITCVNGNATLMVSPHSMDNGSVVSENITATNCGFAVRIENGFLSRKYRQDIGLGRGTFSNVSISNVTSTFGKKAQVKSKHFGFIPLHLRNLITQLPSNPDPDLSDGAIFAPAAAAVLNQANYPQTVSNVTAIGYGCQPDIVTPSDKDLSCDPQVSIENSEVQEGDPIIFTVTLSETSTSDISIPYTITNETTNNSDYTATNTSLTIPSGQLTGEIRINTIDDTIIEGNETFSVNLNTPTLGQIQIGTATGTIMENDGLTISANNVSANEGNRLDFQINLSSPQTEPVVITYQTQDASALHIVDQDYTSTSGTLTIPIGQTSGAISVFSTNDDKVEIDETFNLNLTNASIGTIVNPTIVGTILNNDSVTMSIADASNVEGERITFTVVLDKRHTSDITIPLTLTNGNTANNDYFGVPSTITVRANSLTHDFTIRTRNDTNIEPNEFFTLSFGTPSAGTLINAQATGTILNDDSLHIDVSNATTNEGANLTFNVTLSEASSNNITIPYSTTNGSASTSDYTPTINGILTIIAGTTTGTIVVPTQSDNEIEIAETIFLSFDPASEGTYNFTAAPKGTINNTNKVNVNINNATVTEGEDAVLTVRLSEATIDDVIISYRIRPNSATINDNDFIFNNNNQFNTLTIPQGSTRANITVQTLVDNKPESNERFIVILTVTSGEAKIDDGRANVNIIDGSITLSVTDFDTNENQKKTTLYPNPTKSLLYLSNAVAKRELIVFNSLGKKHIFKLINNEFIDISSLASGLYFVQISSNNIIKIIKN